MFARRQVRYYGVYSNVSRGKRKQGKDEEEPTKVTEVTPPPVSKELKRRWSHFIRKVYETDPLAWVKCPGQMRIISFIGQRDVIRRILDHLGLWEESHVIGYCPPKRRPGTLLHHPGTSEFSTTGHRGVVGAKLFVLGG